MTYTRRFDEMNEKKAKKLRRSLMTHDEWVREKQNRHYVFTEFDRMPRRNDKVIVSTLDGTILAKVKEVLADHTYEIENRYGEKAVVGLEAIKPFRAACAPDKIGTYKEAKKHAHV
jgi:hypothetical protein